MEVRGQLVGVSSTVCVPRIELGLAGNCSYLLGHLADPQILSSSLPPLLPCVHVVFACVCVLVQGNGMQRTMLGVFYLFPLYCLSQGLSLNLKLTTLARLAGYQAPRIPTASVGNYRPALPCMTFTQIPGI